MLLPLFTLVPLLSTFACAQAGLGATFRSFQSSDHRLMRRTHSDSENEEPPHLGPPRHGFAPNPNMIFRTASGDELHIDPSSIQNSGIPVRPHQIPGDHVTIEGHHRYTQIKDWHGPPIGEVHESYLRGVQQMSDMNHPDTIRTLETNRADGVRREQIQKIKALAERKPGIKYAALDWMRTRPVHDRAGQKATWDKLKAAKVPLLEREPILLRGPPAMRPGEIPRRPMVIV